MLIKNPPKSVKLLPLTDELNRRTYTSKKFVNSPIDHIYVWGKHKESASKAIIPQKALELESKWNNANKKFEIWGSDHFPIFTKIKTK